MPDDLEESPFAARGIERAPRRGIVFEALHVDHRNRIERVHIVSCCSIAIIVRGATRTVATSVCGNFDHHDTSFGDTTPVVLSTAASRILG